MATNGEAPPQFEIPAECWAGVVVDEGPNFHIEVQKVPVPEPGPTDVLIKLNATGICHSDIHYMQNDWALPPMSYFGTRCAGHEGAGVIVKVGSMVKNFKAGDRAGFKPIADTCGSCELCWGDMECYCSKAVLTGLQCDGTYKQYVVSPARYTTSIPSSVPDHIAGPIMCSASTIYTSIRSSSLKPGDFAIFPGGGGGVGIQGVQLAAAMGLRPIVVDTGEAKEKLAFEMGAEAFVDFKNPAAALAASTSAAGEDGKEKKEPSVGDAVVALCDGVGAHGVFITAPQAYASALSFLGRRPGATVMCIGLPPAGSVTIPIEPSAMVFRNWTVKGTLVSSMADVAKTLEFAARGKLRLKPRLFALKEFDEAVQLVRKGEIAGRAVVDFNL